MCDGTRKRRVRDAARQTWYARYRQFRFARHWGFIDQAFFLRLLRAG
jgi:hypothetical protein